MLAGIFAAALDSLDTPSFTAWSNISATFPVAANNEDRTITWSVGGARTVTTDWGGANTLNYRIDSGAWTAYSAGFSLTSGQTLAWQITTGGGDEGPTNATVSINGTPVDVFSVQVSGSP